MRRLAVALLLSTASPALGGGDACLVAPRGGWARFLGRAPPPGSREAQADLAIVLWEQRIRTPEEVARVKSEEDLSLEDFATVLGPAAAVSSRYPLTETLLARSATAARPCLAASKKAFARKRPFLADARVEPAAEREPTFSYPSGHATRGALFAAILAELVPERGEALLRRGAQIGTDRVIGGVHFPTDVAAGQRLGAALAKALLADPAFREAVAEARAREWSPPAAAPAR